MVKRSLIRKPYATTAQVGLTWEAEAVKAASFLFFIQRVQWEVLWEINVILWDKKCSAF